MAKSTEWKRTVYEHGGSRIYTEEDGRRNLIADTYQAEDADLIFASKDMLETLKVVKRWMPKNPVRKSEEVILQKINDALEKAGELV